MDTINAEIERIAVAAGSTHGVFVTDIAFTHNYADESNRLMKLNGPHRVQIYWPTIKPKYTRKGVKDIDLKEIYDLAKSMFPHVFYVPKWHFSEDTGYQIKRLEGVVIFENEPVSIPLVHVVEKQQFTVGDRIVTAFGDEGVIVEAIPDQGVRLSLWISHANFMSYNIRKI